jgi:hypothetical protein
VDAADQPFVNKLLRPRTHPDAVGTCTLPRRAVTTSGAGARSFRSGAEGSSSVGCTSQPSSIERFVQRRRRRRRRRRGRIVPHASRPGGE